MTNSITGLTLDRSTAASMIPTIRSALTQAVVESTHPERAEVNADVFRLVTAGQFHTAPHELTSEAFVLVQRAFADTTAEGPGVEGAVKKFREAILSIDPDQGAFLGAAFVASVKFLDTRDLDPLPLA